MIPNIIHQIWIQGYDKIPSDLMIYHNGCKAINDNFNYIVWDDNKIRELLISKFDKKYIETYDNYKIFAQKADFARYAILYTYGGIYLDMDMLCRKNLTSFLKYNFFFTSYMFYNFFKRFLNGIVGSRAGHPVFEYIFNNIFIRKNNTKSVTDSTGTGLFYYSIMEYVKNNPSHDLKMIDRKYLDPCNMYNNDSCRYTCEDCYIAHTNYSSWSPTLRICKFLLKYKYAILVILLLTIILILIKCKFINI